MPSDTYVQGKISTRSLPIANSFDVRACLVLEKIGSEACYIIILSTVCLGPRVPKQSEL